MAQAAVLEEVQTPPLAKDPAFGGMVATQFLGAFNDNVYKQIVLLVCLDVAKRPDVQGDPYQPIAMFLFSLPFVLFSGVAGVLADRMVKRTIFVGSKVAEVVVMLLGLIAFQMGGLAPMFVVLFLMGMQSAFFGPPKYGILPEMLRASDLPRANGIVQTTTFLAIILGQPFGSYLKEFFPNQLWIASFFCIFIAILGVVTSLFVRKTPVADPNLKFTRYAPIVSKDVWRMFFSDRKLLGVLLLYAYFWFICGLVQPAVNAFGKIQLDAGDGPTGLMAAMVSIGIAIGCVLCGFLSGSSVRFGLVRLGAAGICVSLFSIGILGETGVDNTARLWMTGAILIVAGIFTGFMAVPLQVFLQVRPPAGEKGQVMGAMNLTTWIGILVSAGAYAAFDAVFTAIQLPPSTHFFGTGALMLPIALFYRPRDTELDR